MFLEENLLRKSNKSLSNKILAIPFFIVSIFLVGCSSSTKSESNPTKETLDSKKVDFVPATRDEISLYRQIGISYLCIARQAEVEFPKAIAIASNNFALIVSNKHGGLLEELEAKKLSNEQIYQGSYLQIIEGAIKLCPDQVPEEDKKKFLEAVETINNKD